MIDALSAEEVSGQPNARRRLRQAERKRAQEAAILAPTARL
jgi:hypothetical protein